MTEPFVVTRAEVDGRVVDVAVESGAVAAVGPGLRTAGMRVVDAAGGALISGLHDHHLHLLAMAAARSSVQLSGVGDPHEFDETIRSAHARLGPGEWLRAVGLDDRHGTLDRHRLDRLAPGRPVRVQHRSGAAWVLSSVALSAVHTGGGPGATQGASGPRDGTDPGDGWLHRVDDVAGWPRDLPDLAPVGERLARLGVTGVTDATPFTDPSAAALLSGAHRSGAVPQRIVVTGAASMAAVDVGAELEQGPVKVVVSDHELPGIDELVGSFRAARRSGRAVAVHCVTRVGLVLALTAWEEVGAAPGDRVEHGSVIPVELFEPLVALGLTVVTQPGFIADRGDRYLAEVEVDDVPHLYRCRSLLDAGIATAGSTDAPFGPDDPWLAIAAAVDRRAASGAVVGAAEAMDPAAALGLFLGALADPGGPPRRVEPGVPADLVLLDRGLRDVLANPRSDHVRATWVAGHPVYAADG
ncbi:MAG: amidohydrolase family protein [Acidimicrobiales bacterium]|nr:amidohydrolase family protein [Acidimicrobiales bacterium]